MRRFLKIRARTILKYGLQLLLWRLMKEVKAVHFQDKIRICERNYHILVDQIGFPSEDIIFDPNILTVATGIEEHNSYAVDFFKSLPNGLKRIFLMLKLVEVLVMFLFLLEVITW